MDDDSLLIIEWDNTSFNQPNHSRDANPNHTVDSLIQYIKNSGGIDVKEKNMVVEVLGTHFNINSYEEESSVKTTLLEGAVKVTTNDKTSFLKPMQQAQVTSTGEIKTSSDVDVMSVTAWKDGMFRFKNHDIKTVMKQIARWYDVDVEFVGNQSTMGYNCLLPRNIPVSKILDVLVETGGVHFEIDGKKIKVLP
jgi:hypothetical protein